MSVRKAGDAMEVGEGAWFWKRLDQATADYDALPRWMKRDTGPAAKKGSPKAPRAGAKRAA
jgi:hypothetical protein